MYQAAVHAGCAPEKLYEQVLQAGEVHAMIEVHVEQSLFLDRAEIPLGIVTGIRGMRWAGSFYRDSRITQGRLR